MKAIIVAIFLIVFVVCHSANAQSTTPPSQYWKVAGSTTAVWSLPTSGFVPITDSNYVAWLAGGRRVPISIASTSELYDVIAQSYPDLLIASAPGLEANGGLNPSQAFLWRKANGLNIIYPSEPTLNGLYPVDDQWLGGLMTGALLRCGLNPLGSCSAPFPGGSSTYAYLDKQLQAHTMSIVQMRAISLAIEDHIASLYAQLKIGLDGGTPSWPALTVTVP
jgi:hypothetical protein